MKIVLILLLTAFMLSVAHAGDFEPYPTYQPLQYGEPLQRYQPTYQQSKPVQRYQPTFQRWRPQQPSYSAYDRAMELADKEIRRMGGPTPSGATPQWQANRQHQINACNQSQGNPQALRYCLMGIP